MAPRLGENWQSKLAELKDGWDSYGGKPITTAAILALESFSVVPCSDGGIDLVSYRDGLELSIEIQPDGGFGHMIICKVSHDFSPALKAMRSTYCAAQSRP